MAQNEPQRKETPPGPSPNSPSLLFEYQCRSGKFIKLANRIEKIDSVARIESNRIETFFLPELECSTTCQVKFQINKIAEVVSVFITCVHQVLLKLTDFGLKYSKK